MYPTKWQDELPLLNKTIRSVISQVSALGSQVSGLSSQLSALGSRLSGHSAILTLIISPNTVLTVRTHGHMSARNDGRIENKHEHEHDPRLAQKG